MIETHQSIVVNCPIDAVWSYARDVERWAEIMPGYQQCEIADADNSRWVLKVGVGGLVRTVKVQVHVNEWAGPERAVFSFKLAGDPVTGSGSYRAEAQGANATEVTLHVRVEGGGPMAPMWEAMGGHCCPDLRWLSPNSSSRGSRRAWEWPERRRLRTACWPASLPGCAAMLSRPPR